MQIIFYLTNKTAKNAITNGQFGLIVFLKERESGYYMLKWVNLRIIATTTLLNEEKSVLFVFFTMINYSLLQLLSNQYNYIFPSPKYSALVKQSNDTRE